MSGYFLLKVSLKICVKGKINDIYTWQICILQLTTTFKDHTMLPRMVQQCSDIIPCLKIWRYCNKLDPQLNIIYQCLFNKLIGSCKNWFPQFLFGNGSKFVKKYPRTITYMFFTELLKLREIRILPGGRLQSTMAQWIPYKLPAQRTQRYSAARIKLSYYYSELFLYHKFRVCVCDEPHEDTYQVLNHAQCSGCIERKTRQANNIG